MSHTDQADDDRRQRDRLQPVVWVAAGTIIAKRGVNLAEAMTMLVNSAHRDHLSVETLASSVINEDVELDRLI